MRKVLLLALFLVVSTMAKSQTKARSFVMGGGFDYVSTKVSGSSSNTTNFSFQSSAGIFVIDNLAVGLNFGITDANGGVNNPETTGFSVGPFVRYYAFTSNNNFAFYGQADFNIGASDTYSSGGRHQGTRQLDFGISPGFSYFFTRHFATELGFTGIRYTSYDPDRDVDDNNQNKFEFGVNSFTPNSLGIRFYF